MRGAERDVARASGTIRRGEVDFLPIDRTNARRFLGSYSLCATHLRDCLDEAQRLRDGITNITQRYDKERVSGSGEPDKLGRFVERMEQIVERLEDIAVEMGRSLDEVDAMVREVGEYDTLKGQILSLRYLRSGEPMLFEDIAARLGYSAQHVFNEHAEALDVVALLLSERE